MTRSQIIQTKITNPNQKGTNMKEGGGYTNKVRYIRRYTTTKKHQMRKGTNRDESIS
jgi:hypothetical protein